MVRDAILNRGFCPGEGWRADGRRYGWILDCREWELAADVMPAVSRLLYQLIAPYAPQAVIGTGVAGGPLVGALVLESARHEWRMDGLVLRGRSKGYGRRRQLEGPIPPPGSRVAVVDDLENSGATARRVIEKAREYGLRPIVVVTVIRFDERTPGDHPLDDVPRRCLFTLSELGIANATVTVPSPQVMWQVDGVNTPDDIPFSRPAHADGLLIVGSNQGQLLAVDLSGTERWRVSLGDHGTPSPTHCTPVVTQDGVIVGSDDGVLRCVDRDTGRLRWATPCADRIGAGLVQASGHVLVPATWLPRGGALLSVRARDGSISWHRSLSGYAHSRPAAVGTTVVAADNSGTLTAYSTTDEERAALWRTVVGAPVKADLLVDETGSCYCADFDGWLTVLDMADGTIRWRRRLGHRLYAMPTVADDKLYVAGDGHLFTLERRTGHLDQVAPIGPRARGAVARLADGTTASGCADGSVQFVSPTGLLRSVLRTGGAAAPGLTAIDGRHVAVASADGYFRLLGPLGGRHEDTHV